MSLWLYFESCTFAVSEHISYESVFHLCTRVHPWKELGKIQDARRVGAGKIYFSLQGLTCHTMSVSEAITDLLLLDCSVPYLNFGSRFWSVTLKMNKIPICFIRLNGHNACNFCLDFVLFLWDIILFAFCLKEYFTQNQLYIVPTSLCFPWSQKRKRHLGEWSAYALNWGPT